MHYVIKENHSNSSGSAPSHKKDFYPKECHDQCEKELPGCKSVQKVPPKEGTTCEYFCDQGIWCMVFKIHSAFDYFIINVSSMSIDKCGVNLFDCPSLLLGAFYDR